MNRATELAVMPGPDSILTTCAAGIAGRLAVAVEHDAADHTAGEHQGRRTEPARIVSDPLPRVADAWQSRVAVLVDGAEGLRLVRLKRGVTAERTRPSPRPSRPQ